MNSQKSGVFRGIFYFLNVGNDLKNHCLKLVQAKHNTFVGYVPPTILALDGLGPRIDVYEMVDSTEMDLHYHRSVGRLEVSLELRLRDSTCAVTPGRDQLGSTQRSEKVPAWPPRHSV